MNAPLSIFFTELGISICFNEVHPLKVYWPIICKDDGSLIYDNNEHFVNAFDSISLTESGMLISSSLEHSLNNPIEMVSNGERISTFTNDEHLLNA